MYAVETTNDRTQSDFFMTAGVPSTFRWRFRQEWLPAGP